MPLLTERQQQCLRGVLDHKTAKQIGRELGISHHAVEQHLKAARRKYGATDTLAAARSFVRDDTTVGPYCGSSEVLSECANPLQPTGKSSEALDAHLVLRDSASGHHGLVYEFSALQTIFAIILASLGLVAILALLIAVAEGIRTLTA